jgi:hypothetical protein
MLQSKRSLKDILTGLVIWRRAMGSELATGDRSWRKNEMRIANSFGVERLSVVQNAG